LSDLLHGSHLCGIENTSDSIRLLLVVFRQNSWSTERNLLPNEKANIMHENSQNTNRHPKAKSFIPTLTYNCNDFVNAMSNNNYYDPAAGKVPIPMAKDFEPMSVPHVVATPSEIPENILKSLVHQGFTRSLARSLNETKQAFALRIWVIDNSSSMNTRDGHRIVDNCPSNVFMVNCSRWEEIRECVEYHIQLADMIDAPTRFRFLNDPGSMVGPQNFAIKDGSYAPQLKAHEALSLMRKVLPHGCTPLTDHILEIYTEVFEMVPELRRTGQKVAIILATVSFVSIKLQGQVTASSCPTKLTHTYSFISSLKYRTVYRVTSEASQELRRKRNLSRCSECSKDFQFGSSFVSVRYVSVMALL
jgi:hypothetical protein